ncbi:hypothetical protein SETIT_2G313100v2 [Setaria italica]|uniref:Gag1-like clamp domain-containing protein n=2 Tax=Setaria TaxID=4554 RepID=K3ZXK3_SETIT|nr:uncharacterized protein LOC101756826 isoform X1 [Setaria italica]XP_012698802.1 uncharacterized protein LOC101756826 isoform X1 [Setaria italica]XP_022679516.1 uncharacterized protein LOC101756826 isoform X1 [Setaria italica]XP_034580188.1 uncharacterized protein LOC117843647 isoform X1 [Setaria viridis]XP_034580189.1 uncharacterized protein LOC117843647 isoform X1 [Setaria viridis]RCV13017.1 hypothetical protein SETIT_2G313100v2 [Setaria italica]RCV13018.1 hypothetical protein SETIT_2G313
MTSSLSLYGNSGCIGNLSKSQSLQDSKLKGSLRKRSRNSSIGNRRRWQPGLEAMENNVSISVSLEGNISSIPNSIINDSKMSTDNGLDTSFINHAAVAWAEMRRQWVGHQAEVPKKAPREPVISWCTTYDDLLSTSERFPQPIPLSEMVDFLVDIWHEEGLYD